tara:strand:+ start:268 stop:1923 length:1656 start_codon:yes stop_codon:yes gene_type:complete
MNLPEPQSLNYTSLMTDIAKGIIKIPQFQRDFVWDKQKSAALLDSIMKGYPIGTFILWKTKEELRSIRNLGGLDLPVTPKGDYIQYVLDGQQRLTSLFASLNGLKIQRADREEDFSEFYLDLDAGDEDPIVLTDLSGTNGHSTIKLHTLLHGTLSELNAFPQEYHSRIDTYRKRVDSYQFSSVLIKDAPIEVATEIFTRLNVSGKALSVFEIMVAKTFDSKANFDLAEKYDKLRDELETVDYGTVPESVVLQTLSVLLTKECQKRHILKLKRAEVVKAWPATSDAIKEAVEYFRNSLRIPVSKLLPYQNLIVPFAYYFHQSKGKLKGDAKKRMDDYFWRASLGGRYSQSLESHLAQDIRKVDEIIKGKLPKYEWAIDISVNFIEDNGFFSLSRSYVKALLCVLAYQRPQSFMDNSEVRISNDWLKQANSKNYHHFFPKAFLKKQGEDDFHINHIANITIVDDWLNKREIKAKPPSKYMRQFQKDNETLDACMKTHLIRLNAFGIFEDDYDMFFLGRCKKISSELKKRLIPQEVDRRESATAARDTDELEAE